MTGDDDARTWEAAGLYEPAATDSADRLALLRFLTERGATLDDLTQAHELGRLSFLGVELLRAAERNRTAREIAAAAGVDVERVLQVSRVAGLPTPDPDVRAYRDEDVAAVLLFVAAIDFFGEQAAIEFTRSVGAALASIADSAMATFGINVAATFDEREVAELERTRARTYAMRVLTGEVPNVLETLFIHHVDAAVLRASATSGVSSDTAQSAVGFVDLVRSTDLVQGLSTSQLAAAIGTFEQLAVEIVASRQGRVVKTIGDEVMFVVAEPAAACDAALALREAVIDDPRLPDVRGAIAAGALVRGYGDFYGIEVTIAARAVKLADPGAILVTEPVRDEAGSAFAFGSIGSHVLRGFSDPIELFTVGRS